MASCPICLSTHAEGVTTCPQLTGATHHSGGEVTTYTTLPTGATVGEYVIEAKIGEGGFGTVYRGIHPIIGKSAAIKILSLSHSGSPEMVNRFVAEARAVNTIRHKNIVDIFAFGALDDGRRYFVMELLEGIPLDDLLLRRGRMDPAEVITLLSGVVSALDAAHQASIIHRDLKPDNVFVTLDRDGKVNGVKLLDFGIAKLLDADGGSKTRTGVPIGTPHYMSPEQCRGRQVSHRTDIYSLGIMMFRMLTGRLPFDAPILRMLEKEPERRPASVREAFEHFLMMAGRPGRMQTPDLTDFQSVRGSALLRPPGEVQGDISNAYTVAEMPSQPVAAVITGSSQPVAAVSGASLQGTSVTGALGIAAPAPAPSKAWLAPVAAMGVVALAAIGYAVFPSRNSEVGKNTASQTSNQGSSSSTTPQNTAAPPSGDVTVKVLSTPPDAEVFLDDVKLGAAPGPFHLPKKSGTLALTVRASGYVAERVEIPADSDGSIVVRLGKEAAGATGAPTGAGPSKPVSKPMPGPSKPKVKAPSDLEPF